MPVESPAIIRESAHQAFIRRLNCLGCLREAVPLALNQCAHIRMGSDGGMALKPSDSSVVPLCNVCHTDGGYDYIDGKPQHQMGEKEFWRGKGIDPVKAAEKLYQHSGNEAEGRRIILEAWLYG